MTSHANRYHDALLGLLLCFCAASSANEQAVNSEMREAAGRWFELQCVDAQTKRGIPMVELATVNHLRYVTDNEGRVAFCEPGLMGQEVFFHVRSSGYEVPSDGFGYRGVRVRPESGKRHEIRLQRLNVAERLYRITGEGRLRDSILLGYFPADEKGAARGLVSG